MSDTDQRPLDGLTVGVFVAQEGTEEVEFSESNRALAEAGADVEVLSSDSGEARTVDDDLEWSESHEVDATFADVSADDYDALVVPGGTVGADTLRADDEAVALVRDHLADDGPVASICHGPWVLVEAEAVEGRTLTSYPSLRTDVRNAGGEWVDEEVVADDRVVTSRKPDDLAAFTDELVETFAAASE
ncbi:type 1 glutamine amidotransferase [Halorussus gelatinilyticus]|uniref:Type 1 glutamine amidotransferase n=1 Tax=Halorussus gelatinilyticus TaxID=2937524 RepID=A0A8U0IGM1_9EURY|nr:type 1 glutamine amidotransferase domain-containing protein [Halorussus gelatinilyticus]UPV99208.1 type 1 glutamine amidotransferase [Halorussus gelatinilyticus]